MSGAAAVDLLPPLPVAARVAPAVRAHAFNEMRLPDGVHPAYQPLAEWLGTAQADLLDRRRSEADARFRRAGITFAVYGDTSGQDRLIPFDLIPRIIGRAEWATVSRGCIQRVRALNAFLDDIYHDAEILRAGVIPRAAVLGNALYLKAMQGVDLPYGVHAHIAGVDVVRTSPNDWYVLEDNLRTPSGVSYMLENRAAMRRLFPELFARQDVAPIDHYPDLLLAALRACAPFGADDPQVVVLTPGAANSAYYEHGFLAQGMGVPLVEGRDLVVSENPSRIRSP